MKRAGSKQKVRGQQLARPALTARGNSFCEVRGGHLSPPLSAASAPWHPSRSGAGKRPAKVFPVGRGDATGIPLVAS